jgi:hypothetical protein
MVFSKSNSSLQFKKMFSNWHTISYRIHFILFKVLISVMLLILFFVDILILIFSWFFQLLFSLLNLYRIYCLG